MAITIGEQVQTVRKLQGEKFYGNSIREARQKAEEWVNEDQTNRRLSNLVDLAGHRIRFPNSPIWEEAYDADSSEESGKTPQGNKVVLISHGNTPWTAERIQRAYDEGLTNLYGGHLTPEELNALLEDAIPFNEYKKMTKYQIKGLDTHRIVLDLADAKKLESGVRTHDELRESPLFIARLGGVGNARDYLDANESKYSKSKLGNWHIFGDADFNSDENQGRVLYLGRVYDNGVGGNYLDNEGRFLGEIASETQRSTFPAEGSAIARPTLDKILELGRQHVSPIGFEAYHSAVQALYNK